MLFFSFVVSFKKNLQTAYKTIKYGLDMKIQLHIFVFSVEKLKEGEEYMFRIIAVNEVGKSDPSPGTKYILVQEPKGEYSLNIYSI